MSENKQFMCSEDKTNIFLIGDSIRMGYCNYVKEELEGEAEVFFTEDNNKNTQTVIKSLGCWSELFSDPTKVDIVHFNCGHWDAAHFRFHKYPLTSETEYKRNISIIIDFIRDLFPNAKIIFATTNQVNPSYPRNELDRTNEEIDVYNTLAKEVSERKGIAVSDLNSFTKDWDASYFADYCHFTDESNKILGKEIAERLRKMM